MSHRYISEWNLTIEGWPSKVVIEMDHYQGQEQVVFVTLSTPGIENRYYHMRWVPDEYLPEANWRFEQPTEDMPPIPEDLLGYEEAISDHIVSIDS